MGMGYTPNIKGLTTTKQKITVETVPYEWDKDTTPDTTYIRYEDTDKKQYIERAIHGKHTVGSLMYTYWEWSDKENAPEWGPIEFSQSGPKWTT